MAALGPSSCRLYLERCHRVQWIHPFNGGGFSLVAVSSGGVGVCSLLSETRRRERRPRGGVKVRAFWQSFSRPTSVELEAITETEDLDRALAEEAPQAIVIDWMASWCRKCIYLKPKLEGLAAEYHPRVKFYFVDVNKVPQALVKRGNVTKLPTIQLWKDGKWKAEVIGGHEAWLVINEVREMIKKHL